MKKRILIYCLLSLMIAPVASYAQQAKKVGQVEIRDSNDNPIKISELGSKALLIFYVDPDKANQNAKFTDYLEEHQINSPNIYSFGIVNLKDAPLLPNGIVRSMLRKKERKTDRSNNIYGSKPYLARCMGSR